MKNFLNSFLGVMAGLLLAGVLMWTTLPPRGEAVTLLPPPKAPEIVVYITGAVANPGNYNLPANSRVSDALDAAGGLAKNADATSLNLAARLDDGQQLQVPARAAAAKPTAAGDAVFGQRPTPVPPPSGNPTEPPAAPEPTASGLVNINTASLEQLDTLPGIGPTIAQRIIDYRTTNGPFQSIEELMNVSGIGPATFDRLKALITI